ncbi:MAG: shikimate kinase [Gammaproteobacteria bacterium]|nr:shikimate kinase [Gammaproteobacteria bacterium]
MGAGKTTVGKRLARALRRPFLDCDVELVRRTGASIPLIFELESESGFRAREKRLIEELTLEPAIVLATGGGAVIDADNRRVLSERGLVVYLHAPIPLLVARTRHDHNRPLLQTEDRAARLSELMAQRVDFYREIAHVNIDTSSKTLADVVQTIRRLAT